MSNSENNPASEAIYKQKRESVRVFVHHERKRERAWEKKREQQIFNEMGKRITACIWIGRVQKQSFTWPLCSSSDFDRVGAHSRFRSRNRAHYRFLPFARMWHGAFTVVILFFCYFVRFVRMKMTADIRAPRLFYPRFHSRDISCNAVDPFVLASRSFPSPPAK